MSYAGLQVDKALGKVPDHNGRYILDEKGVPVPEPDLLKWARWFENPINRRIRSTAVKNCHVSTVFLGLDHSFGGPVPLLYETMVFGKDEDYDGLTERYATKKEAIEGHKRICKELKP